MPLAVAIAGGLVAALFYLSVLTGSPGSLILVYLVQLPLYGVGLSLGFKAAAIAGGTATLAALATSGLASGALFCVTEALPVALMVRLALCWRPDEDHGVWSSSGALAVALALLGGAALVAAAVILSGEPEGFRGTIHSLLSDELGAVFVGAGLSAQEGAARAVTAADLIAPLFPAMAVGSWLFMTTINGLLAQGALARFGLNHRPSPDIAETAAPRWLTALLAAAAVLAIVAPGDLGYLGRNLLAVLAIAYVFAGLGVVHAVLRRYAGRIFVLVPVYALLLLGWPILLLAVCGIIDQWFGLRSRFAAAAPR
jgi:hypothetical protein